jgi:hypothetical protein
MKTKFEAIRTNRSAGVYIQMSPHAVFILVGDITTTARCAAVILGQLLAEMEGKSVAERYHVAS